MLNGTLLALANERGAREHYGNHSEIAYDLHYRCEPTRVEIRVKFRCNDDLDWKADSSFPAGDELRHIVIYDILDVSHTVECLCRSGGIHVDLNRRLSSR